MPQTTQAAVWHGGSTVTIEELPVPPLQSGEVLVEITLATVCGSDRHTVNGRRAQPHPSVLGHEAVGRIVALEGAVHTVDGEALRIGDRVIWSVTLPCGQCDRCQSGLTAKCRTLKKTGHEAMDSGWALSGGYAHHILLPRGMPIARVYDALSDVLAAPAACATATVMAVIERAGELRGRRIAVVGAGMLGLTATAASASAGARDVVAVDPDAGRRALAERFGAGSTVADTADLADVDVLLEFSGSTAATQEALARLTIGGVAVLAGAVAPGGDLAISPEYLVRNQLSLRGQHNYEPRHLSAALRFLGATAGDYPWEELVAPPQPLTAIHALLTGLPGPLPRYSVAPSAH